MISTAINSLIIFAICFDDFFSTERMPLVASSSKAIIIITWLNIRKGLTYPETLNSGSSGQYITNAIVLNIINNILKIILLLLRIDLYKNTPQIIQIIDNIIKSAFKFRLPNLPQKKSAELRSLPVPTPHGLKKTTRSRRPFIYRARPQVQFFSEYEPFDSSVVFYRETYT